LDINKITQDGLNKYLVLNTVESGLHWHRHIF